MKILALIPARMGSSRFPGKPMAPILGKPMIGHVYERVAQSSLLDITAVATCDKEIFDYIESIGGTAVMTGDQHERASDRCAEALAKLEQVNKTRYDIVVMVQGDEPMTHPDMIAEAVQPLLDDPDVQVVNLLGQIKDKD
jgi:3-deoxy-manno-octulosonate cytidylyltransferase (CMP-KDO synthetase)